MAPRARSLDQAREVAERLAEGWPQSRIADELGLTPSSLSRRVAAMRALLVERTGDPSWLDPARRPAVMVAREWLGRASA
jgi:DNA-binding transcriptional LysR family regulator